MVTAMQSVPGYYVQGDRGDRVESEDVALVVVLAVRRLRLVDGEYEQRRVWSRKLASVRWRIVVADVDDAYQGFRDADETGVSWHQMLGLRIDAK
jgi:hypothetical protein